MVHPQDRKFQILRAVQVGDVTLSEERAMGGQNYKFQILRAVLVHNIALLNPYHDTAQLSS